MKKKKKGEGRNIKTTLVTECSGCFGGGRVVECRDAERTPDLMTVSKLGLSSFRLSGADG
jgi:hypothetical protein